jgi:calcineurin-like phosphoesterase family protein
MSDIFFTSDTHFDHKRIIELCGRPFDTVEQMNEALIENWNARIKPGDTVYHLGDFAFSKDRGRVSQLLGLLHGTKHLIQGNHDHEVVRKAKGWNSIELRRNVKALPVLIVVDHYPIEIWHKRHYGSIHLFGHIHEKTCEKPTELRHNISVDFNEFRPLSLEEIGKMMEQRVGVEMDKDWSQRFQESPLFDESIPHFHRQEKVWYE